VAEALPVTAWGVAVTPYRPLSSLDRFSSYRRVTKFATARRATAPSGMSKRASIACYLYFSRANSPRGLLSRLSWLSESGWRELILKAAHDGGRSQREPAPHGEPGGPSGFGRLPEGVASNRRSHKVGGGHRPPPTLGSYPA